MNELERLRAEAVARRRAATAKVARARRTKGVELAGSEYDPRKPAGVIKRYNRTQLTNYIRQLNEFTARSSSFIPGAANAPIPVAKWRAYKAAEANNNRIAQAHFDNIKNVYLPGSGMTIGEREEMIMPTRTRGQGASINKPFTTFERKPHNIANGAALDKLTKDLEQKLTKGYLPNRVAAARKSMNNILEQVGNAEFQQAAKKLSNNQFAIMWFDTPFGRAILASYEAARSNATRSSERDPESVLDDYSADLRELFKYGSQLPKVRETPQAKTNKRR